MKKDYIAPRVTFWQEGGEILLGSQEVGGWAGDAIELPPLPF